MLQTLRWIWCCKHCAESGAANTALNVATGDLPVEQYDELSVEDFWNKYERQGRPCMIAGAPEKEKWPAWTGWEWETLAERFGNVDFKIGKDDDENTVKLKLNDFLAYMETQQVP